MTMLTHSRDVLMQTGTLILAALLMAASVAVTVITLATSAAVEM